MSNVQKNQSLSEEEYIKKILTPLYNSGETREEIIDKGKKQVEELIDAEKNIQEQMNKFLEKYKNK